MAMKGRRSWDYREKGGGKKFSEYELGRAEVWATKVVEGSMTLAEATRASCKEDFQHRSRSGVEKKLRDIVGRMRREAMNKEGKGGAVCPKHGTLACFCPLREKR